MDKEGRFLPAWREFEGMMPRLREEQRLREQERNSIAIPYLKDNFMALSRFVWPVLLLALIALGISLIWFKLQDLLKKEGAKKSGVGRSE